MMNGSLPSALQSIALTWQKLKEFCLHYVSDIGLLRFISFRRRDRTQEVQSLRLCQGHPNIVNIHEVYQDGVSIIIVLLVVWYGMVWYGVVWCGVVWCGVVWCGVVWCGVVWCGVVWCGMVWYGMVWCIVWLSIVPGLTQVD